MPLIREMVARLLGILDKYRPRILIKRDLTELLFGQGAQAEAWYWDNYYGYTESDVIDQILAKLETRPVIGRVFGRTISRIRALRMRIRARIRQIIGGGGKPAPQPSPQPPVPTQMEQAPTEQAGGQAGGQEAQSYSSIIGFYEEQYPEEVDKLLGP